MNWRKSLFSSSLWSTSIRCLLTIEVQAPSRSSHNAAKNLGNYPLEINFRIKWSLKKMSINVRPFSHFSNIGKINIEKQTNKRPSENPHWGSCGENVHKLHTTTTANWLHTNNWWMYAIGLKHIFNEFFGFLDQHLTPQSFKYSVQQP